MNTYNTIALSFLMSILAALMNVSENATPGELQYLVNQINCLKKIGLHANIAEMLLLPESGNILI